MSCGAVVGHRDGPQDSHERIASHPESSHLVTKKGQSQPPLLLTRLPASKERSSTHPEETSHVLFEPLNSQATHAHTDHLDSPNEPAAEVGSSSEGSDLPPSYEEALEMPKPASLDSPNYMNVDTL